MTSIRRRSAGEGEKKEPLRKKGKKKGLRHIDFCLQFVPGRPSPRPSDSSGHVDINMAQRPNNDHI